MIFHSQMNQKIMKQLNVHWHVCLVLVTGLDALHYFLLWWEFVCCVCVGKCFSIVFGVLPLDVNIQWWTVIKYICFSTLYFYSITFRRKYTFWQLGLLCRSNFYIHKAHDHLIKMLHCYRWNCTSIHKVVKISFTSTSYSLKTLPTQ